MINNPIFTHSSMTVPRYGNNGTYYSVQTNQYLYDIDCYLLKIASYSGHKCTNSCASQSKLSVIVQVTIVRWLITYLLKIAIPCLVKYMWCDQANPAGTLWQLSRNFNAFRRPSKYSYVFQSFFNVEILTSIQRWINVENARWEMSLNSKIIFP